MLSGIATLRDAGLRRNYLCRVPINRAIVEAAVQCGLPAIPLAPAGDALQHQLTRMLAVAARLNEQHDSTLLRELLLDELVELSGAERILLLLRAPAGGPEILRGRGLSAAALPALRLAAAHHLDPAIGERRPALAQTTPAELPAGAPLALWRRSLAVVPLVSGGHVIGAIYADLRHAFGNLDAADLDLLGLLGAQAATALENARLYAETLEAKAELERRVAERTADLQAANAALALSMLEAERARAAAESASAAKSTFLANMSHELRTPLNAVLGFAQLMGRDPLLTPTQRDRLAVISRSGEHLLELINDVLEMAKIEAGRLTLNVAAFDLRRLIAGVVELFEMRAAARQVELVLRIAPELPPAVLGDAARLRQILINLISNALKFTHSGAVTIKVDARPAAERLRLRIAVADTGEGIAASELGDLFRPFMQTASGRRSHEGTGLGLAISQQFARLMGGDIRVESTPNIGSTFTCEVEVTPVDAAALPAERAPLRLVGRAPRGGPWRVLIADDGVDNRRLLRALLGEAGFEVREAGDGAEAVKVWQAWRPQLVLMDMRMLGSDGYSATRAIKATPAGRSTVVIAVTALALAEDQEAARASGCDDLLIKPVRAEALFELIARHLGLRLVEQQRSE